MSWNNIKNQEDIDFLLREYCGFHDACICSIKYVSGANVDANGSMCGISKDNSLLMKLKSQCTRKVLELKFIGLRRINLMGYSEKYFSDIFSCYLGFYKDYIIWADDDSFKPASFSGEKLFKEPVYSYAISSSLEWRFCDS